MAVMPESAQYPRITFLPRTRSTRVSFYYAIRLVREKTKDVTSQKSFPGSGLQTLFSAKPSDSRKIRLRSQARYSPASFDSYSPGDEETDSSDPLQESVNRVKCVAQGNRSERDGEAYGKSDMSIISRCDLL